MEADDESCRVTRSVMIIRSAFLLLLLSFFVVFSPVDADDGVGDSDLFDALHKFSTGQERLAGYFSQCVQNGSVTLYSRGRYELIPDSRFSMDFVQPNRYTLTFYRDGTYVRNDGSTGKSPEKYNALGSLMFSMLSMDRPAIEGRFEVQTAGTVDDFEIVLMPQGRITKIFRSVMMAGRNGLVETLDIVTSDAREIAVSLYSNENAVKAGCS